MDHVQKKKKIMSAHFLVFMVKDMYSTLDYIGHATTTDKMYGLKNTGLGQLK
jgi:hypothetical protein